MAGGRGLPPPSLSGRQVRKPAVCMCICVCAYVCVHVHVCVCVCAYMCVHVHVCVPLHCHVDTCFVGSILRCAILGLPVQLHPLMV